MGSIADSSTRGAGKDRKDLFEPSSCDTGCDDSDQEKNTSDGNSELDILGTNPKALKKFFVNEVMIFFSYSFYRKTHATFLSVLFG